MTPDENVEEVLASKNQMIYNLGLQVRAFILRHAKDIYEMPDPVAGVIGYGFGPGSKELVCTIVPSKTEVKLGFAWGRELPDPHNRLTGSGKAHRYVVVSTEAALADAALRVLLLEAVKACRERMKNRMIL